MKYLFGIITTFYLALAVSLLSNHLGVAQNIAKYLFGIQVVFVLFYLLRINSK